VILFVETRPRHTDRGALDRTASAQNFLPNSKTDADLLKAGNNTIFGGSGANIIVGNLGVVRMTQIGPTIAAWFDVALSPHADAPLVLQATTTSAR